MVLWSPQGVRLLHNRNRRHVPEIPGLADRARQAEVSLHELSPRASHTAGHQHQQRARRGAVALSGSRGHEVSRWPAMLPPPAGALASRPRSRQSAARGRPDGAGRRRERHVRAKRPGYRLLGAMVAERSIPGEECAVDRDRRRRWQLTEYQHVEQRSALGLFEWAQDGELRRQLREAPGLRPISAGIDGEWAIFGP